MTKHFPCPVTTIFSRRVRPGHEEQYEEWLQGINRDAASFPGFQGVTILRPGPFRPEYLAIVQFDSAKNLERWMISDEREDWLAQLEGITLDSEEIAQMTGLERWFTLPDRSVSQAPPRYKTALLVLVGLYPLALVLNALLRPLIGDWPPSMRLLVSLSISVPAMVWIVMPQLTRLFFSWLYPEPKARREDQARQG